MDLNGSGQGRGKLILLGGAALAGVLAVVLIGLTMFGEDETVTPPGEQELHFVCDECGGEFVVKGAELSPTYLRTRLNPDGKAGIDCRKCGQKACAYMAIKCRDPKCGKYYITNWCRHPSGPGGGETDGEAWSNRCTHCGTDPAEWDRARTRRR